MAICAGCFNEVVQRDGERCVWCREVDAFEYEDLFDKPNKTPDEWARLQDLCQRVRNR